MSLYRFHSFPLVSGLLFPFVRDRQLADGGDDGIRTHDPLLAGQVLSQLSYTPMGLWLTSPALAGEINVGLDLSSRAVSRKVLSALQSLTSVFGMGTGGPSAFERPTFFSSLSIPEN